MKSPLHAFSKSTKSSKTKALHPTDHLLKSAVKTDNMTKMKSKSGIRNPMKKSSKKHDNLINYQKQTKS